MVRIRSYPNSSDTSCNNEFSRNIWLFRRKRLVDSTERIGTSKNTEVITSIPINSNLNKEDSKNEPQASSEENAKSKAKTVAKSFAIGSVLGTIGMLSYFEPNIFPFAVGAGIGILNAAIDRFISRQAAATKNVFLAGLAIGTAISGVAVGVMAGVIASITYRIKNRG
ncbi:MAG: hypothetical protein QW112_00500 [Candidatus Micrarchaeia archaeon]